MRERRKYVRTDGLVLVNYKEAKLRGKSSAYDVSGAGLRITVGEKLKRGSAVEMELFLPGDSQPILAKGEVVWVQKYTAKEKNQIAPAEEYFYTGIKFTHIEENNRNKIVQYVQRRILQTKQKV